MLPVIHHAPGERPTFRRSEPIPAEGVFDNSPVRGKAVIRTTLHLGPVFTDWTGEEDHTLCLDLTDFKFFIDSKPEFVPFSLYLRKYPERRTEVLRVLNEKLN